MAPNVSLRHRTPESMNGASLGALRQGNRKSAGHLPEVEALPILPSPHTPVTKPCPRQQDFQALLECDAGASQGLFWRGYSDPRIPTAWTLEIDKLTRWACSHENQANIYLRILCHRLSRGRSSPYPRMRLCSRSRRGIDCWVHIWENSPGIECCLRPGNHLAMR